MALIGPLVACASVQTLNEPATIDGTLAQQGVAELRFIRQDSMLQMLVDLNLQMDGQFLASVSNGQTFVRQISPGMHVLSSKLGALDFNDDCDFNFSVEPGEIQYISLQPSSAGVALPIISLLTNPFVCKFDVAELSFQEGELLFTAPAQ